MGIGKIRIDISDVRKEIQSMSKTLSNREQIMTELTNEISLRLLRKTREATPVGVYPHKMGGTLRRGWKVGEVTKSGDTYTVEISNNVYYAPYVEYGHRTANHRGWVNGQFMLTISEQEMEESLEGIIRAKLEKMLGGLP